MPQSALCGTLEVSLPSLHDGSTAPTPASPVSDTLEMTAAAKMCVVLLKLVLFHESNSRSLEYDSAFFHPSVQSFRTILADSNISLRLSKSLLHWSASSSISASSQGFPTQSRETLSLSINDMRREGVRGTEGYRGERLRPGSEEGTRGWQIASEAGAPRGSY